MSVSNIFLVIAAAIAGCGGGTPVSPAASPGAAADPDAQSSGKSSSQVIELQYDKTVDHRDLKLRWLTLADSRCPIGVTCVWAGQMLATVEVLHNSQGKVEVELLRRAGRDPEVAHAFGYEMRLLNVDPHPKRGLTTARVAYLMQVEITRP